MFFELVVHTNFKIILAYFMFMKNNLIDRSIVYHLFLKFNIYPIVQVIQDLEVGDTILVEEEGPIQQIGMR